MAIRDELRSISSTNEHSGVCSTLRHIGLLHVCRTRLRRRQSGSAAHSLRPFRRRMHALRRPLRWGVPNERPRIARADRAFKRRSPALVRDRVTALEGVVRHERIARDEGSHSGKATHLYPDDWHPARIEREVLDAFENAVARGEVDAPAGWGVNQRWRGLSRVASASSAG